MATFGVFLRFLREARLVRSQGYFRFSADAWMLHFYEPSEDRAVFDAQLARCKAMIRLQAEKLLAAGQSVVLDDGFWTKVERDETRRYFTERGFAVRLEVLAVDLDTQVLRSLKRQAEDGEPHFDFDEATIAVLNSFFEKLGVTGREEKFPARRDAERRGRSNSAPIRVFLRLLREAWTYQAPVGGVAEAGPPAVARGGSPLPHFLAKTIDTGACPC